jgi:hypothetical protein
MHNSIVRHAESESVAILFSHGLLDFCTVGCGWFSASSL